MNATEFARTLDSVSEIMGQLYGLDLPEFIKELEARCGPSYHFDCLERDVIEALAPAWALAVERYGRGGTATPTPPVP